MKKAALGFRVHSGWSAVVVLSLEKGVPVVLRRQRLQMVETFSYTFRQPYHTAAKMPLAEGAEFVDGVRSGATSLACTSLRGVTAELKKLGWEVDRASLPLASGRALPTLEKILGAHALIHTADGELFREAIRAACGRCGLRLACVKERELLEIAAARLAMKPAKLLRRLTELGRAMGPPWSQDEKFATLAAWLSLNGRRS